MVKTTKFLQIIIASIAVFFVLFNTYSVIKFVTYAVDTTEYEEDLAAKEAERLAKEAAIAQLRGEIESITQSGYSLDQQIYLLGQKMVDMQNQITQSQAEIEAKQKEVDSKEAELDIKKKETDAVAKGVYKNTRISLVELFLSQFGSEDFLRSIKYREYLLESQISIIKELTVQFEKLKVEKSDLLTKKHKLEIDKQVLEESKGAVDSQKAQLLAELATKNQSQAQLNADINNLNSQITTLQQQIIILKSGGTVIGTNSVPASGDQNATLAGFRANAPAGYFGVFSFGAYTHRNGMSQWGAQARAVGAGGNTPQSAQQIISAYFPGSSIRTDYPVMQNISVSGYGTISFEENYLYGIAEMPGWWNLEALKAQAILARTYAIRYTGNGVLSICTSEACQVYNGGAGTDLWRQAVNETRGQVLVDGNGNPLLTEYASTHGGYGNGVGWDTADGTNQGDWTSRAWDSLAGHPWFYRIWYRQGYSDSADSCGRMGWMSEEEMADIINAWMILKGMDTKPGADYSRVYSNTGCGGGGGGAYSMEELRNQINDPVTSITGSPIVIQNNSGQTDSVYFETNRGAIIIGGADFKNAYNLRAPAYLRIPQSGFTFFNVERN